MLKIFNSRILLSILGSTIVPCIYAAIFVYNGGTLSLATITNHCRDLLDLDNLYEKVTWFDAWLSAAIGMFVSVLAYTYHRTYMNKEDGNVYVKAWATIDTCSEQIYKIDELYRDILQYLSEVEGKTLGNNGYLIEMLNRAQRLGLSFKNQNVQTGKLGPKPDPEIVSDQEGDMENEEIVEQISRGCDAATDPFKDSSENLSEDEELSLRTSRIEREIGTMYPTNTEA